MFPIPPEDAFQAASPVAEPVVAGPQPLPNDDNEDPREHDDDDHEVQREDDDHEAPAANDGYEPAGEEPLPAPASPMVPASPTSPKHAAPSPPPSPQFRFGDGQRPSCPQATWDPEVDNSQRMPGLTPENEAWLEYQKTQKSLNNAGGMTDEPSVPSTVVDSPPAKVDAEPVCVSDDEPMAPRDLSPDLDQAVGKEEPISGLIMKKGSTLLNI